MSLLKKFFGKKEEKSKAAIKKEPPKAGTTVPLSGNHQGGKAVAPRAGQMKQAEQISKDAEDYRKEGIELEQQEKYEEAFLKYEEASKLNDTPSMVCIAKMYLSGKFRPVDSSNLAELLVQGSPMFPWNLRDEKRADYKSGLEWLTKAADLGDGLASETAGNMLCGGIGCRADVEKGLHYLEKAVENGQDSARKYICLYRPNGKVLTDEEYEVCLAAFSRAAEAGDDKA